MKKNITIFWRGLNSEDPTARTAYDTVVDSLDLEDCALETIQLGPDGSWLKDGQVIEPEQALLFTDYAWIAGYGPGMEDGTLQRILDSHHVPYNGSDALLSRLCSSKSATKDLLRQKGIATPVWERHDLAGLEEEPFADQLFRTFPQPCVIKADTWHPETALYYCRSKQDIEDAVSCLALLGVETITVEEYIPGQGVTVGVISNFRDHLLYTLPAVSLNLPEEAIFAEKYIKNQEIFLCPASLEEVRQQEVIDTAEKVHRELGLGDYTRTDMIVHPHRGVLVLETNTLPGLNPGSAMRLAMDERGITVQELIQACVGV